MQASLPSSVERNVAEEACLVSAPREHGQRHRNWYVDADLADFNLSLELASSCARVCEDCGTIPVRILVDDSECIVKCVCLDDDEDWAEDLLTEWPQLALGRSQVDGNMTHTDSTA